MRSAKTRYPATLIIVAICKAVAWIVAIAALVVAALVGASAGSAVAAAVAIGCVVFAAVTLLVLYATAEGLMIAVDIANNTSDTSKYLSRLTFQVPEAVRRGAAEGLGPNWEAGQSLDGPSEEIESDESDEAPRVQGPITLLCPSCKFRILPTHTHCPGCGKRVQDIKPIRLLEDFEPDEEAGNPEAQQPVTWICPTCRYRILPTHTNCPGCSKPVEDMRPIQLEGAIDSNEEDANAAEEGPIWFLCPGCSFRILPSHARCQGCGKLVEDIGRAWD